MSAAISGTPRIRIDEPEEPHSTDCTAEFKHRAPAIPRSSVGSGEASGPTRRQAVEGELGDWIGTHDDPYGGYGGEPTDKSAPEASSFELLRLLERQNLHQLFLHDLNIVMPCRRHGVGLWRGANDSP